MGGVGGVCFSKLQAYFHSVQYLPCLQSCTCSTQREQVKLGEESCAGWGYQVLFIQQVKQDTACKSVMRNDVPTFVSLLQTHCAAQGDGNAISFVGNSYS